MSEGNKNMYEDLLRRATLETENKKMKEIVDFKAYKTDIFIFKVKRKIQRLLKWQG